MKEIKAVIQPHLFTAESVSNKLFPNRARKEAVCKKNSKNRSLTVAARIVWTPY